ncbi:MAG TPA: hypothetical protein VM238_00885 [Phycisphaerae bacterium]|nr:hypothetical protein [Phycisphaerae bacterium]
MARRKDNPWLPSGGVLVVAVIAAVLAGILLNVYVGYLKSSYEVGSVMFLQMKREVPQGRQIESGDITTFRVPKPMLESFSKVVKAKDADSLVIGRKTRRTMFQSEFLQYMDFLPGSGKGLEAPRAGYERMTIFIQPEPLLQPGAFITIRGYFDTNPDPKKEDIEILDVLNNVQVKAIGGSAETAETKRRSADNIQIEIRTTQVTQLLQISKELADKHFIVSLSASPTGGGPAGEPKFSDKILDYLARLRTTVPTATP